MDDHRSAGPQLEDGHVRIANELYDAILEKLHSYRHIKVAMAIIRKTYGYRKKEDDLTVSQLASLTGIHRNNVGKALTELEAARVINPVRPGAHGLIIGINKHHEQWQTEEKKARGPGRKAIKTLHDSNQIDSEECNQIDCTMQSKQCIEAIKTLHDSNQNVAHNIQPQKTTPKDNSKRETRKPAAQDLPPAPDWMPEKEWADFVEHRKQIKHPLTALASSRLIEKIGQLKAEGHSPKKLMDVAIRNGWRDVFPKDETRENAVQPAQRPAPPGKRWVAGLLVED